MCVHCRCSVLSFFFTQNFIVCLPWSSWCSVGLFYIFSVKCIPLRDGPNVFQWCMFTWWLYHRNKYLSFHADCFLQSFQYFRTWALILETFLFSSTYWYPQLCIQWVPKIRVLELSSNTSKSITAFILSVSCLKSALEWQWLRAEKMCLL